MTEQENSLIYRRNSTVIYRDGSRSEQEEVLLTEHELNITVNEKPVIKLVCTKEYLQELIIGRLFTEGFIDKTEDVDKIYLCRYETEAAVLLNKEIDLEEKYREDKTCCTGNRIYSGIKDTPVQHKLNSPEWKPEWIFRLSERFAGDTYLHEMTRSTHSCMLARGDEVLFSCEDIGRHNAIDKAVGYGLKKGIPLSQCILYTSGRVPVDMAEKSIRAEVPVLVSKSVPTAEAVRLAEEYGLVIIGKARTDSMRLYTAQHPDDHIRRSIT